MRIRIIDAFTDKPFAGNPAAVCLLDTAGWPPETWIRQVAAGMNLLETAFAHPLPDGADGAGGRGGALAVVPEGAGVRASGQGPAAVAAQPRRDGTRGLIATAAAADPGAGYDFVSRFFVPSQGVPEDPVTGSAHTAL